jgi:hypothetical protein
MVYTLCLCSFLGNTLTKSEYLAIISKPLVGSSFKPITMYSKLRTCLLPFFVMALSVFANVAYAQIMGNMPNHAGISGTSGAIFNLPKAEPRATYTYKVTPAAGNNFGYEIWRSGRPMIKQTTIPGVSGNKGFATSSDAVKVAELMIGKLKRGEMPPSVTPEELKTLKVIK